jgi:hypothetical protein
MKNKVYYHVVMRRHSWVIKTSKHKNPFKVKNSINSYAVKERAWDNINNPKSKHFGVVKRFINFI